ncbi:protein tramtrack, beta isoform-like isoform X5 [Portunus trituberculatus]|uniref:protein tramtrack, beta isoform-like isoform X5 n=1 Tax=Portunus trituberculatus TaxID=210409 RepID=UPI001E1CC853|nr:protein tramtrack, beta isoform-like isoform X5 [Portunus trituberculatus]
MFPRLQFILLLGGHETEPQKQDYVIKKMDGELLSLKWNNHRTTFYHVISGLRNKETYTDVTLACEGKFYPVHKLVLSTCSEYFSDIFDRTPCKNPVVVLKDINCQDLEFLLDYMYIGEVNVRQNELSSLIKAAECLRIKGLAVPDEEPKKNGSGGSSNNTSAAGQGRQRPELATPPAKRRRAEERRVTEQSPGRPPGDGSPEQEAGGSGGKISGSDAGRSRDQLEDKQSDVSVEQPAVHIKVEQHDSYEQSANDEFLVQSNSYEGGGGGGGEEGDGPHSSEGNTNDFPEFLQSTVEKEEPVAMSDFNPSDFPGPSGLQNSGMSTWEGDNSSTSFAEGLSGAVAAAVAAASQPQQQRQQQQLWARRSPWVSGSGRQDTEVCTNLEDAHLIGQTVRVPPEEGPQNPQRLQEAFNSTYRGSQPLRKCPYCPYTSRLSSNVRRHVRTHTGEMPYSCPQCAFRCKDASSMKRHQTTHTRHVMLPSLDPMQNSAQV